MIPSSTPVFIYLFYTYLLYTCSLYKKDSTRAISLPTLDKTQCAVQKQKQTVETQIPYDSRNPQLTYKDTLSLIRLTYV